MAEVGFSELIKRLDAASLAPAEIGRTVGKPGKDVNSELAKIRAARIGDKKSRRKE